MRPGPPTHVYVIGADEGPLKVGISYDPKYRLKQLRAPHGIPIRVLASNHHGEGKTRLVERLAHRLLAERRVKGEHGIGLWIGDDALVVHLPQDVAALTVADFVF
jgi:hypothetical protein